MNRKFMFLFQAGTLLAAVPAPGADLPGKVKGDL
jgi:hypothetical protein